MKKYTYITVIVSSATVCSVCIMYDEYHRVLMSSEGVAVWLCVLGGQK